MTPPVDRISPVDEYPGPEREIPLTVQVMECDDLGSAIGRLVPPSFEGGRCAIWTGVSIVGREIVVDLEWQALSEWVSSVLAARRAIAGQTRDT